MSEREQRIRIAVVDDHEMFRAGVIATLQPYFDVVGQAADVEGSVAMIAQTKPDVVLLDLDMPHMNGREALAQIVAVHPELAVLMLTVSEDGEDLAECMRLGARGYLLKNINAEFLLSLTDSLKGLPGVYALAGDTDGIDGSEDNAGAIMTPDSYERAAALGQWCQGFLSGFGLTRRAYSLSDEANEVLRDLAAIAQVQDALEESEDGESDYMEVMEYLRVAPMLLFSELAKPEAPAPKPSLH